MWIEEGRIFGLCAAQSLKHNIPIPWPCSKDSAIFIGGAVKFTLFSPPSAYYAHREHGFDVNETCN